MKKLLITLLAAIVAAGTINALDFKIGKVPDVPVPVTYTFTTDDIKEAMKAAIHKKYPNADLSSTNNQLVIQGLVINEGPLMMTNMLNTNAAAEYIFTEKPAVTIPFEAGYAITNMVIQTWR